MVIGIWKRKRHITRAREAAATECVLDHPHCALILRAEELPPRLSEMAVQASWWRNVRSRQRRQSGLINQEESHGDLEDTARLQLAACGELLVHGDARLHRHARERWQSNGEGGDDIWDRKVIDVGAAKGIAGEDGEGEQVLWLAVR